MAQIRFTERDIQKAKSKQGIYREVESKEIHSVLLRHVIRLVGVAFREYKPNKDEWIKFREILKRTL